MTIFLATTITTLIVALGYWLRALSASGAVVAFVVGILVLGGTGAAGALALGTFFVTSSIVSRKSRKHEPAWLDAPGHRRNASQVAANGAAAAIGGIIGAVGNLELGLLVVTCSLAAAAADTWATSLGMGSPGDPVDIWRRTRVPKGTSGGVSARGTLGGIAGAVVVAAAPLAGGAPPWLGLVAATTGIAGMVLDSLLGAGMQGRFHCDSCSQPSERRVHRCGRPTRRLGGFDWLDNDGVNAVATTLAGAIGAAWWTLR